MSETSKIQLTRRSKADLLRVPALDRDRPARDRLFNTEALTRFMLWTLSAACVVAYIAIAAWAYAQATVPDVYGMPEAEAMATLQDLGLQGVVVGTRNSTQEAGEVVQQIPAQGEEVGRDGIVELTLSAGITGFVIPDVLGEEQATARLELERLGLQVEIRQMQSDAPPGTVLLTTPVAGTRVLSSEPDDPKVVTLYVATHVGNAGLVNYHLNGLRVVIEPHYTTTAYGDVSFDVARRLSSLFEAADADVTVTRFSRERDVEEEVFATRATQVQPQLHIVLSIRDTGRSGISVRGSVGAETSTDTLVFERLRNDLPRTTFQHIDSFGQANADRVVEVVLGSTDSTEDVANFAETFWRDRVARGIYMASAPQFSFR